MQNHIESNSILYQIHIMWYESQMINETLDSLKKALDYSQKSVNVKVCLNSQTYIEDPIEGNPKDMFDIFLDHPVLENAEIVRKTNDDTFYNVGDWRRDIYNENGYTVWGESDCLVPWQYFAMLESLEINHPHIFTLSSRKCWDNTWTVVEHEKVRNLPRTGWDKNVEEPLNHNDRITLEELENKLNDSEVANIVKLPDLKIDGAMVALSPGLPRPFISSKQHFFSEDTSAEYIFRWNRIPQYHCTNIAKGHNYHHPLKRTNTDDTRKGNKYKKYSTESKCEMVKFLNEKKKEIYG